MRFADRVNGRPIADERGSAPVPSWAPRANNNYMVPVDPYRCRATGNPIDVASDREEELFCPPLWKKPIPDDLYHVPQSLVTDPLTVGSGHAHIGVAHNIVYGNLVS